MKSYFGKLAQQGIDISKYTMTDVIDDVEDVRKALGYGKIHLLSFSYGTRLALVYCMRYPESISRVVLAGANPPGHFNWIPEKTEEILHRWDRIYTAAGRESLVSTLQQVLERMPEKWACYRLDKDKIKCGTFLALSQNNLAVMVFDAYYRALEKGDYSGIYMISLLFDMAMKNVTWGDMYSKGASADMQDHVSYRDNLRRADSTTVLGPSLSLLLWGTIHAWNDFLIPMEYRSMRVIPTETLVVSGDLDVPTPADYARDELMPYLPSGKQVVLQHTGHGDLQTAQPEAYHHMINHFYNTGQVDTTQFKSREVDLRPSKKLYRIAKVGFPILMVMGWVY
jgi:pimeloyl-ACP methyl ester carboxylesterase